MEERVGQATGAGGGYAPGSQILVRDEEWLVRTVTGTQHDRLRIEATGVSDFVRDTEAVFYESLDDIRVLDPRETRLVPDTSRRHRRGRLYLEAVIRKSFLPQTEHGLALSDNFLMNRQTHQLRPAELALSMRNPQPRLLIADVVGLGKTLEIGILLAELIRRGRGERILVVTPLQVLEQFQRELWTRFAIPLVRLDSTGIQRVQREIPAGRNPFAYFKRVIVSVDTLKNRDLYRHHLDATRWDAVVIDESHNLISSGSQRNELARALERNTDALILASATPHNGDPKSFAELIRLLDPAAITDPSRYTAADLEHLFIRRTKVSPEVRDGLKGVWADRGPSQSVQVAASAKEEKVFELLSEQWMPRTGPSVTYSNRLFPFTLLKSFLSSHTALLETIDTRIKTLTTPPEPGKERDEAAVQRELSALGPLREAAAAIGDGESAKLAALVAQLEALGVGPESDIRVVVFSERIATLKWLAGTVPARLGFTGAQAQGAVAVLHADSMSDQEQHQVIERFGLRDDPVRLLLAGDVASEGVNLHQQCHQLIHYDLPWSLIRIEQRNGRIDRYGQAHRPQFRALILTSAATGERILDDRMVGEKLLRREEHAHRIEGTAEGVTGLYSAKEEERRLVRDLVEGRSVEQSISAAHDEQPGGGFLGLLTGQIGAAPAHREVPRASVPRLFPSTKEYFDTALKEVYDGSPERELNLVYSDDNAISFVPPPDLQHRLRALPDEYLREKKILGSQGHDARLVVTFDQRLAAASLRSALDAKESQWPNVSYLTDIHPVLDWITDKVLVQLGRHEAPVLHAIVAAPVFLVQGIYSNKEGRPTVVEWMAVTGLPGRAGIEPLEQALHAAGVSQDMNGLPVDGEAIQRLQILVPHAIDAAQAHLEARRAEYDQTVAGPLEAYRRRLKFWKQEALPLASEGAAKRRVTDAAHKRERLVDALETTGGPMLRLLAVLDGGR
jgi:superfamily II DNA or RNA helicase